LIEILVPNVIRKIGRLLVYHWPAVLIGSIWLWMFWPMISGQTVCGFRDSAYLYYPLFKWIDSVWAAGEIPLWNPYCNYGLPVVGDGSSSVFYPGKLIFLCRFLSYPSRYGTYLSSHVLIAAVGAYQFARGMKANQAGSTLASISYAFGGSVLFQVTNVIYLVSAAWLPFALLLVWRGILGGDWRSTVWAGVVCALMILGGDPQMVYHVGLIAAASLVFRFWKRRRWLLKNTRSSCHEAYRWLAAAGARLLLMVIVTSCLAAIQILPTAHWAERSERADPLIIANIYHAWNYAQKVSEPKSRPKFRSWVGKAAPITHLDETVAWSLLGSPAPDSQTDATYQFSQPPWSIAELFFPNVMGKPFPTHQRWSDALPAAERIWTPSLYAGVLTILLALSQFRLWGKRKRHVWLCRIGVFFAVASLGWFGFVWLMNEGLAAAGLGTLEIDEMKVGPQVGGLYWFMVTFLPKYFMFRYPAKLFLITSLMISVLAGLGLSPKKTTKSNPFAYASSLYSGVAVSVLCIAGLLTLQIAPIESWLERIRPNLFFGPMDVDGTISALNTSFLQPLIVLTIAAGLTKTISKNTGSLKTSRLLAISIVLLTTLDVSVANRWMLAEVDPMVFEAPTKIGTELRQLKADYPKTLPRICRSFNVQARNQTWPREKSSTRLEEIIAWQRETLFPKQHLEHEVALLGSFGSVWPSSYRHLSYGSDGDDEENRAMRAAQRHRERFTGRMVTDRPIDSLKLKREVLVPPGVELLPERDWHDSIFSTRGGAWPLELLPSETSLQSFSFTNRRITAKTQTEQDLQLQVCVLCDEGWRAKLEPADGSPATELKITPSRDQIGMRVDLPRGNHTVTFTYSPREFWIGCWISGISWLLLVSAFLVTRDNLFRRSAKTKPM